MRPHPLSARRADRRLCARSASEQLEPRCLLAGASLVADVSPDTKSSNPDSFVTLGSHAYFVDGNAEGLALWKTDGTPAGTHRLTEPLGSATDGSPRPDYLASAGGRIYFSFRKDETGPARLWTSDGTAEGTERVEHLGDAFYPSDFTEFNGRVVFTATDGKGLRKLWATDGTPEGTVPLDVQTGPGSTWLTSLRVSGGLLYFVAPIALPSGGTGTGLWRTDGTQAGTVLLRNLGGYRELTDFNGTLVFAATSELWKSDGTPEGTVPLRNLVPGLDAPGPYGMVVAGDALYFAAQNGFWTTDGTGEGTRLVSSDLRQAPGVPSVVLDDAVICFAQRSVWRTDGTAAGTFVLRELPPLSPFGIPTRGVSPAFGSYRVGDVAVFAADDGASGLELWKSDGTVAGTVQVADANPGWGPGVSTEVPNWENRIVPRPATVLGGRLIYRGAAPSAGPAPNAGQVSVATGRIPLDIEPWASDGTAGGTLRLADVNQEVVPVALQGFAAANGYVLFNDGNRLFRSDGTADGTVPIAHLVVFAATTFDGAALLHAMPTGTASGTWLYRSDGTPEGTYRLTDTSVADGRGGDFADAGDCVYFFPPSGGLWKSDGTKAGTYRVARVAYPEYSHPRMLVAAEGRAYFLTNEDELWTSDGTPAGTVLVRDLDLPARAIVKGVGVAAGRLLFRIDLKMWTSDGTAAGTVPLRPDLNVTSAVRFNEAVYFRAYDAGGWHNFRTDGTEQGTVEVLHGVTASFDSIEAAVSGRYLYFQGSDPKHGTELWRTDGTATGTGLVSDAAPGTASSTPYRIVALPGGRAFFLAIDGVHGREPWYTDGTSAGTAMAADIYPGPTSSEPRSMTVVGDTVYFTALDPAIGWELWRGTAPAAVAGRHVFYNDSALDGRDGGAGASDDAAVAVEKQALRPGEAPGAANVTGYTRGINGMMIDLAGLPQGVTLMADDFEFRARRGGAPGWAAGPAPREVAVRHGAGASGADRVTLVWDDPSAAGSAHRAVADGWLEVTVKANGRTGLSSPDTFRFGNLRGDTGGAGWGRVDAADYVRTRAAIGSRAAPSGAFDHNRDGRVNVLDLVAVRRALFNTLVPVEEAGAAATSAAARLPLRRAAYGVL